MRWFFLKVPQRILVTVHGSFKSTISSLAVYFLRKAQMRSIFENSSRMSMKIPGVPGLFVNTYEDHSLLLSREGVPSLIVVAGRQIVTADDLEVLALGTSAEFADGGSLKETVGYVRAHRAIPVIPWGFGKWLGKRGRTLMQFLNTDDSKELFLGDNSGRLRYGKQPGLFKVASSRGMRILPGSDPLPFKSQMRFPGRYGLALSGEIDLNKPAEGLKELLSERATQLRRFGGCSGILSFCYYQLAMQLNKRMRKRG